MDKQAISLGMDVEYSLCYSRDTRGRFPYSGNRYASDAVPIPAYRKIPGHGIVIQITHVIMSEYKFTGGYEDCPAEATGKREPMLVVSYGLYRLPVLVRLCDVTKFDRWEVPNA